MSNMLIVGAGNIGRGLLGQLAYSSGYRPVFIEASPETAFRLRARGDFTVSLVAQNTETFRIADYGVLEPAQTLEIEAAVVSSALAAVAVGGRHLPEAARLLAPGLGLRTNPLNILVCENWPHAETVLLDALIVRGVSTDAFSCVRTSVERMVRGVDGTLDLVGEGGQTLYADAASWRGPFPDLRGLLFCPDVDALYARKLYSNNAGHAALAYLGALAGKTYLHEALELPGVKTCLEDLLTAAGMALCLEYNFGRAEMRAHLDELMHCRFANRGLADTVQRVAREPLRKLARGERLVGLVELLARHRLPTRSAACIIAAALRYQSDADAESLRLQEMVARDGAAAVLRNICGFEINDEVYRECLSYYEMMGKAGFSNGFSANHT